MNKDINEIIPHLFISNWFTSNNLNLLIELNINAVITVEKSKKPLQDLDYYEKNNIEFLQIPIDDSINENINRFFDISYDFIDKNISQGKNVLVHCFAGISRSSAIVINYMIKKFYKTSSDSTIKEPNDVLNYILKYVQTKRNIVNPNSGFMKQLLIKSTEYKNNNIFRKEESFEFFIGVF